MNISKEKASEILKSKITLFQELINNANYETIYDKNYARIYIGTEKAIESLFGEKEFKSFRMNVATGYAVDYNTKENRQYQLQYYIEHLQDCITHLNIYIDQINDFFPEDDKVTNPTNSPNHVNTQNTNIKKSGEIISKFLRLIKKPLNAIIVGASIVVVGGVILHIIFDKPNKSYKQTEVDFYNWLEDYDRELMNDFEFLLSDFAARGVFYSGEAITISIEYFKEFRRKRDNKIDSFLVAYSIAGGDIVNLSCTRKLPINVHNIIKSYWNEDSIKLESYRLDTI